MTSLDESETAATSAPVLRPAGWYDDPQHVHAQRFFNGTEWTAHVTHHGPKPCPGCALERRQHLR